jgi:peptide/nickel transport system permease protein
VGGEITDPGVDKLLKYIIKRLIQMIPTLFVVAMIVFVVTRVIPGDPAAVMLGPQASVEAVQDLRVQLGLDKSLPEQLCCYLGQLARGDFGTSFYYNESVVSLILERFPNTLLLTIVSIALAILVGIPIGVFSATKQYSVFDYIGMIFALIGVSMPIFWLGMMLVLFFSVNLGWLPAIGMGDFGMGWWDFVSHLILPCVCLATIPAATFARITRSSMLEVIRQDYIKTARAKGLNELKVVWKHALKNALPPIITVMGIQISMLLSGAILTETIFSWPGMGKLVVDAIEKRDYGLVQGSVMFIALLYVNINLIVDLLYMVVNPKVVANDVAKGGDS